MKILLLDDSLQNRQAGKKQLEKLGHEVVLTNGYGQAIRKVRKESFDVALIDLMLPAELDTLNKKAIRKYFGIDIPIGFPMIFYLVKHGIRLIALATDINHHDHPISASIDWIRGRIFSINDCKVMILHAKKFEDGTKDWEWVLNTLMES